MHKLLIATLALIALAASAVAQQYMPPLPRAGTDIGQSRGIGATSGNVANATATANIGAGASGSVNFLCGFSVRSLGATAATTVTLTVTGVVGGFNYSYFSVAGATTANQPADVYFHPCLPSTPDTAISVSLPALGAGNTNAYVNAWGYRY